MSHCCCNAANVTAQGLPTERTDNGTTALHFAARNGHPEVVTILLACPIVRNLPGFLGEEVC